MRKGLLVGGNDANARWRQQGKQDGERGRRAGGEGACVTADVNEVCSLANGGHVCKTQSVNHE